MTGLFNQSVVTNFISFRVNLTESNLSSYFIRKSKALNIIDDVRMKEFSMN